MTVQSVGYRDRSIDVGVIAIIDSSSVRLTIDGISDRDWSASTCHRCVVTIIDSTCDSMAIQSVGYRDRSIDIGVIAIIDSSSVGSTVDGI
ncbi:hypothetical protein BGW42_008502, partial [Actinomortierella wolfii]